MEIVVLNGSPRPNGNVAAMIAAFTEGATESGHNVTVIPVCKKKIAGCIACEYCHNKNYGVCIQKDDMQEVYKSLESAEIMILASPMYYHNISGQLQSAISRMYALGKPKKLKKCGMFLSSRIDGIYDGITEIHRTTARIMGVEDLGIITSVGEENSTAEKRLEIIEYGIASAQINEEKSEMKLNELRELGRNL